MSDTPLNSPGLSGAQVLVSCLERAGVELVFGYPGGAVIPLYDAIYDAKFKHILTRHEQAAAHAADGYARATGRVGVVVATSGPGATNIVTGVATANMDSVPLLAITGQVPISSIGNDAFQEADIYGISMPITKYNYLVKDPLSLAQVIDEALYLASSGRPGPVLVDVPKDIQTAVFNPRAPQPVSIPGYEPRPEPQEADIEAMVEALRHSQRPLAYLGGGVNASGAAEEIFQLLCDQDMPAAVTLMAKGCFPEDHPLSLGLPGMHGAKYCNLAIYDSDLIVCLGARFDDRVAGNVRRFAPRAKIVHVDIDAAEIGKRVDTHIAVVGDLKSVLQKVAQRLTPSKRPQWRAQIEALKAKYPLLPPDESGQEIKPQAVIRAISELTDGQAIIVTDVGQHQMWAAQFIVSKKPRRFLSSGGLGTMGYGLPAAMGAALGRPDLPVILICGDGGFQMNIQELATIREHNLPVKMVIINNGCLGMVRQWQEFFYQKRYSATVWGYQPDFVKIAAAYDIAGRRVQEPSQLRPALKAMLEADGPYLLDFKVAAGENVLPMIPAGGGQTEFYSDDNHKPASGA